MNYNELLNELKNLRDTVENLAILGKASFTQEIEDSEMPVAYNTFKKKQKPPFITILYKNNDDLIADNINYVGVENFQIELYTVNYHPPTEKKLEKLFKGLGLAYEKSQTPLQSGKLYQTVYDIQLIGG